MRQSRFCTRFHDPFFKGDLMKTVLRFLKPYKTKILLVILCMAAEAAG